MADSTSAVPREPVKAPAFLKVFDAFRRRPKRSDTRRLIRMERRAARRLPAGGQDHEQRGDWAEPPPVLDLGLDHPADRDDLLQMLTERCGNQPVWRLPETAGEGDGEEGPPGGSDRSSPPEPRATTQELYALLGRLVARSEASRSGFLWRKRAPAPPRFRRLRSLLWLSECNLRGIRASVLGEELGQVDKPLADSRRAQIHVIADLRRVKQQHIGAQAVHRWAPGEADPDEGGAQTGAIEGWKPRPRKRFWLLDNYIRGSHWLATLIARVSSRITFGKLDAILLTPLAFAVNVVAFMAPFALGTFSIAGTFGSAAQGVNNVVTAVAAVLLLFVYLSLAPFLVLPWNAYRWLNLHRYDDEDESLPHHRARGIHVLNLIKLQWDLSGWLPTEPHTREAPGPRPPARKTRRTGSRGLLRLFSGGRSAARHTSAQTERDAPEPTGRAAERIPVIHRLAVNAFLDDLALTHSGTANRPWFPLVRGRDQRPVLILDQDRVDGVGAYLVRLIEDERLRRGFPDPLLIVQVRDADSPPLADGGVPAERYRDLPEAQGRSEESGESLGHSYEERDVARWMRARHASGQLGRERTVTLRVPQLPRTLDWNADRPETANVWPVPALTAGSATLVVVLIAGVTFPLTSVVPSYVQSQNPCVAEGVQSPPGITRTEDDDCVGVTFGAFSFHDRLERLTDEIHEQNRAVEEGNRPHVTVVYFAELNTLGLSDLPLSGVQGELLGLAEGQKVHNERNNESLPRIKLMLANAGDGWSHARTVAQHVVGLSRDESLGMDRPLAVIGLGQSVRANTEAIAELSAGELPMVGTTATFDDVALLETGVPSPYFFPMAPANSRLARQAAHWAYHGVPNAEGGAESWHMEPAGSAVAIANNGEGEDYGPHLAVEFMDAFEGEAWEGEQPPPAVQSAEGDHEVIPGILPYGGESTPGGESATHARHLEEVCSEDPPDVIYFAGRSFDFQDFYDQFREEGLCADAEVALLGGDDIAKYVTDRAQDISDEGGYPVFYTPLAASGPWNEHTNSGEHRIYDTLREAIRGHYPCRAAATQGGQAEAEDGDGLPEDAAGGRPEGNGECVPEEAGDGGYGAGEDDGLPSIAHAVMAHDGFRVISRALQSDTDGPAAQAPRGEAAPAEEEAAAVAPSPAAELFPQEEYVDARGGLLREIQGTDGLSLASGEIRFGRSTTGNWYSDRMVQLVQVGELSGQHWQRAIATCGHITPTTVDAGPSCL